MGWPAHSFELAVVSNVGIADKDDRCLFGACFGKSLLQGRYNGAVFGDFERSAGKYEIIQHLNNDQGQSHREYSLIRGWDRKLLNLVHIESS